MNLFSIIHRYVLRRHIGPFIFSLMVITLIFLLNLIFRELGRILSKGIEFKIIMEFFMLNLAWILAMAIPMALLTATIMAFGALSSENEITAMKASGVSLFRIISFMILVATFMAIFMIWFNNAVLPDFNHRARLLSSDIGAKRPTLKLEPGILLSQDKFNIMVNEIVSEKDNISELAGITIFEQSGSKISRTILADYGELRVDPLNEVIHLNLHDGEMHEFDWTQPSNYRKLNFPDHVVNFAIPGLKLTRRKSERYSDREMNTEQMLEEVAIKRASLVRQKQNLNQIVQASLKSPFFHFSVGDSNNVSQSFLCTLTPENLQSAVRPIPINDPIIEFGTKLAANQRLLSQFQQLRNKVASKNSAISQKSRKISGYLVEVHKKYSIPVACIVFILIGAPLGIMSRRGSMATGASFGLLFFIVYWAFLIGGEELANREIISPVTAMWAANVIVGILGIFLTYTVVNETPLIRFNFSSITSFLSKIFRK